MPRPPLGLLLLVPFLVAGLFLTHSPAVADPGGIPHMPGEVLIKWKTNASQADKDQIKAEMNATKRKAYGRIKVDLLQVDGMTVDEAVGRYKSHPKIEYIEPNYIWQADEIPNDPQFPQLWGMENTGQTGGTPGADISATNAWDVHTGTGAVVLGVIDTGVDYTHPDLAGNIWTNPGEIPGNGIDDDGNGYIDDIHGWDFVNNDNDPMDDNGHGSHCSGTIGAVGNNGIGVAGVIWDVQIMALKFLSAGGSGSTADAVEAIEYATMMGVRLTSNSWGGGGFSQAMLDAINDANANGILFIAAAGNSGSNNDVSPHYPSNYNAPNVISVAATDHNDQLASFSSYGATTVDLAAPGVNILSTFPGNTYGSISGTSMATPHVSGAAALVFSRFPAIGHLDAKNLILNFVDPLPNLSGVVLTGGRLNAFFPIADPDSIPPAAITDLAVTNAGSNWLTINWSAPGDDGNTGTASRYRVRYSTSPIGDEAAWDAATPAPNPPDPGPPGTPESMTVYGLDFDTTYYFAAKGLDEFGNAGPVSNSPSGTTLGIPDIASTPLSMSETLLSGATSTQNLTISNVGFGTLDFEIPLPEPVLLATTPAITQVFAKGEVDPRPGILGLGGPDGFGYRWVDSDEAFGPVFAWTDISGVGTVAIASGDDVNTGPFPIGFDFSFYGVDYDQVRVCSNGWFSFTSTANAYSNQPLPSGGAPANLVAPFWDDLNVSSGDVYVHNDGTRFIVQWEGVPHYDAGGPYTFQAILDQDGTITFQYLTMAAPLESATIGIQNGTGSDGLQVAYNTAYMHDGLAVRMQASPQWATVTPNSGTIYAPNSTILDVNFDTEGLLGGVYEANLNILSNDPDESPYTVPLTLTVIGAPDIALSPLAYDFGQVFLGATPSTDVLIQNPGTDVLTVSSVVVSDPAYTLGALPTTIAPKSSAVVTVTFSPGLGTYPALLTVESDDPDEPSVVMTLNGEGVPPPDISASPTSLSASLFTGQTEMQQVTLANAGGADLEWSMALDLGVAVTVYDYPDLAKGEVDANAGILGTGGPDTFGYSWIDSDEPGGPAFDWTDISGVGTPVYAGNADDSNQGPFPIGFDFPFYGNDFSTFRVSSNGFISFTSSLSDLSNAPLPGTGAPENLLAVFHDDMYVDADIPSQVYYHYDGSKLIVQFDQVRRYNQSDASPPFYTMQAILYPNGTIVYQYETVASSGNNSATIGIQNATQDDGLTVVYNDDYVHDGLAIRFSASAEWLTAGPTSGVIPPGGSQVIDVTFNAADLFGGLYVGSLDIATNDPLAPLLQIPCELNVTGAPNLYMDPASLAFGDVYVGYPELLDYTVANTGTDDLVITGIATDNPRFNPDLTGVTLPIVLPPLGSTILRVRFTPVAPGPQSGNIALASNDPGSPEVLPVSGNGVLAPVAGATPTSLYSDLLTGETEVQVVTLSNSGASDLNYEVQSVLETALSVPVYDVPDLAKGEEDPGIGILGSGGPDVFGYSWIDSDDPGGPVFDWTDISGVGTPVYAGNADDSNQGPFPIGFDFPFYGNDFPSFRVSSNGFISFTSTSSDLSNAPLPGTGAPENLLAVFHDDMYVDADIPSQVYYHNDGSRLIVQFDQIRRFNQGDTSPPFYQFQAILYPSGTIVYQYNSVASSGNNSATIGIQNATRDDGLTIVYNDDYVHDGLAIRIGTVPEWLSTNPVAGTLPPGGSASINVTFDAAGLFGGTYNGEVRILSNDPANGLISIPAVLDVTGVPRIGFSDAALAFGDVYVGYDSTLPLTVTNVGTDHLSVSSISAGLGDYSVDTATLELDPLQSQVIMVTFAPGSAGPKPTDLTFASNDPDSPHAVALTGNGVTPPVMEYTPASMIGTALPGMTVTETMTICNTGGSDLVVSMGAFEAASAVTVHGDLALAKTPDTPGATDEADPRPSILGTGGPDTFGYTWTDSDEVGGPTYDWVEISGIGTPVPFPAYADDGNAGPVPIGFAFPFYGNSFTELNVCSNGWMSFTSTLTTYTNQPLPNSGSSSPENLLAPWWDDMVYDESDGNSAYYYNDGSRLIIQMDIRRIASFTPPFYKFQVILYPNGNIVYQYHTLGTTLNSSTIGIQNAAKDDGLTVVHNDGSYIHEEMAILFTSGTPWLSVSPEDLVIPAGECADVTVTMDASDLDFGTYYGSVDMTSNDPANPTGSMDVTFIVAQVDAESVDVDPNTLNLDSNGKWITATVELPAGYDPADVVPGTVLLNMTVAADPTKVSIDGQFITFKFPRSEVEAILPEGDDVEVCVIGEIMDTAYFVGCDMIRVIRPHLTAPSGGEELSADTFFDVTWENPQGWNVGHAALYYSIDDGSSWTLIADNVEGTTYQWMVPSVAPAETAILRVYLFDNQGVMGYDTSDGSFSIQPSVLGAGSVIPNRFALHQNMPNPFRGATKIAFDLPQDASVDLSIYDVRGRLIRVLEKDTLPAGQHAFSWDGMSDSGQKVAAGIYFYRIRTGSEVVTKRMLLVD